jgi:hypothetical protein
LWNFMKLFGTFLELFGIMQITLHPAGRTSTYNTIKDMLLNCFLSSLAAW